MTLKLKPLRTLFRCHWFGKLAKPTYPVNFRRTMFLMSLACCAAIFGSDDVTLCGISIGGDDALPFMTTGEALIGAGTPFAAK